MNDDLDDIHENNPSPEQLYRGLKRISERLAAVEDRLDRMDRKGSGDGDSAPGPDPNEPFGGFEPNDDG